MTNSNFEDNSKEIVEYILEKSENLGFRTVGIQYSDKTTQQLRFYDNKSSVTKVWLDETVEIFAATEDGKISGTNIQDASHSEIDRALTKLSMFLKNAQPSPFYKGLLPYEQRDYGDLDRFYDSRVESYSDVAGEHVKGAINAALERGAMKSAGLLEFYDSSIKLANNLGLDSHFRQSSYQFTIRSFVGGEETGQGLCAGRDLGLIEENLIKAGQEAGDWAQKSVNSKLGKAGQYDIILSPTVSANLFGQIYATANPLFIVLGFSPFKDKIGEQIGPEWLQVYDNGTMIEGPASRPLDFEGTPTQETQLIENGVLTELMHSYSSSQMMGGGEPTGNTVLADFGGGSKIIAPFNTNLDITGGDHTLEELMENKSDRETIFVTSNWYTRFTSFVETSFSTVPRDAILTIENGEFTNPIKKIRLSDNILEMIKRTKAATREKQLIQWWEVENPVVSPYTLVEDVRVTIAGK